MPKFFIFLLFSLLFIVIRPSYAASSVVINEILPTPSSGNDWVELYNSLDADVDISGWILDDEGTSTDMLKIPENTTIIQQSFKLFYVSNRLNKAGDTIYLKNANAQVDKYEYTSSSTDVSFGRYPDGSDTWATCSPTPESANIDCDQIEPSPTPLPSASSTSTKETSTAKKSPSPSPKASSQLTKSKSPSPISSQSVLGESDRNVSTSEPLTQTSLISPSPTSSPQAEKSATKTKFAAIFVGSGIILIGISLGFYLVLRRRLQNGSNG